MDTKLTAVVKLVEALLGRDVTITGMAVRLEEGTERSDRTIARANRLVDEIESDVRAMGKKK